MKKIDILKINDCVSWIGIPDRDLVTFDIVMQTRFGTTYNSYFIDADKKAVIDTTKINFWEPYLAKIKEVVNPSDIEIIVANHTEPDHSGNIKNLLALAPKAKVYGSRLAINYLNELINEPFDHVIVKDGDELSLGNKTLKFISAPNLHWPDSMFTYLKEDGILFTCDSFGAHYCDERMFDDLVGDYSEAYKYYFDVILKPFSRFMLKAIEQIRPLEIRILCPGHGPIIRTDPGELITRTQKFAEQYLADAICETHKVLITYVSAYGNTRIMAETIAQGILEKLTCDIEIVDLEGIDPDRLEEYIIKSNALLIGSPTINQNTVLPVYKMLSLINPIRDKGKKAAVFGSYGWSGEAIRLISDHLKALKLNIVLDGLLSRFSPGENKLTTFIEFGNNFALELLKEKIPG